MNLKNKHIFFLGTTKFDGPDQSTSYNIAKSLAKDNIVYYIDYPYTWKDYLKLKGSPQFQRRKPYFDSSSDGVIHTDNPNFKVIISPPVLSINFLPEGSLYRMLLKVNERKIAGRLKKLIKAKNISDFIFINSFNFHYPGIAGLINPGLTVYHCVDPMIIPYDMKHGVISENELVRKSDLVICTSKQLYREKLELNSNTHFVPNAADPGHSSQALSEDLAVHPKIAAIKKPIIGYVGTIERRLDYDLLKEVIGQEKDKSFVFVGPQSPEFVPDWFRNIPNLYLIGRLPHDEIPSVIKGVDVTIIPFKKDEVSATIFPLKLFEYLGSGKPVVATNFNPDLEEFTRGTVAYCEDAACFSSAINNILKNDNPDKRKQRIEIAEENTWEKRTNQFADLIVQNLRKT